LELLTESNKLTGIRIEDFYDQKFHKEPYYMNHLYAQYFHPTNLLERVRDVGFYRRPRTFFKGFKVPDWATAANTSGWETDAYSRQAWKNAMHEFHSETTPMPFFGERQEPNPLQWFRLEQFGKGNSSRLFYNELPEPWWNRFGGHMDTNQRDELIYSFTNGDQEQAFDFGIDTTTEEGRAAFKEEFDAVVAMAPEMFKGYQMLYPHEMPKQITNEPHFQRMWMHYREHSLRDAIREGVDTNKITSDDASHALKFLGKKNNLSVTQFVLGHMGARPDLAQDESFQACERVFKAIGLELHIDQLTAEPFESQFWKTFDHQFALTEIDMREKLPLFIADPANRHQAQALMEEKTQQLAA